MPVAYSVLALLQGSLRVFETRSGSDSAGIPARFQAALPARELHQSSDFHKALCGFQFASRTVDKTQGVDVLHE
ncbi:hypothetical protein Mal48_46310 [Thalassoglobus polymorphus]|uniref:Uncharacterized protein n=1 Tax=Thalassoglobus polymorphus TaxID=2527994 RepID=A0A517QUQ4_9PLAN|nr:hypothetical protein Mal48_46310 [Thalassoglobus polymorphus]